MRYGVHSCRDGRPGTGGPSGMRLLLFGTGSGCLKGPTIVLCRPQQVKAAAPTWAQSWPCSWKAAKKRAASSGAHAAGPLRVMAAPRPLGVDAALPLLSRAVPRPAGQATHTAWQQEACQAMRGTQALLTGGTRREPEARWAEGAAPRRPGPSQPALAAGTVGRGRGKAESESQHGGLRCPSHWSPRPPQQPYQYSQRRAATQGPGAGQHPRA